MAQGRRKNAAEYRDPRATARTNVGPDKWVWSNEEAIEMSPSCVKRMGTRRRGR